MSSFNDFMIAFNRIITFHAGFRIISKLNLDAWKVTKHKTREEKKTVENRYETYNLSWNCSM